MPWHEHRNAGPQEASQITASRLQHGFAIGIRRLATKHYGGVLGYAEATNQSYDRLIKVLRGAELMRLDDIAAAVIFLELDWPVRGFAPRPDPMIRPDRPTSGPAA